MSESASLEQTRLVLGQGPQVNMGKKETEKRTTTKTSKENEKKTAAKTSSPTQFTTDKESLEETQRKAVDYMTIDDSTEDTYCLTLKHILESSESDMRKKFDELFIHRYGIMPQRENDKKLQQTLLHRSLSENDLLLLTQRHFNEYGGCFRD